MGARIDETLLRSFRADEESLRDLDAIVRSRSHEIDSSLEPEYEVARRDSVTFTTHNVEDILAERNGSDTRVQSIVLRVRCEPMFSLTLTFEEDVRLKAFGDDRAKTILFVSDVRSLIRDRFQANRFVRRGSLLRVIVPAALALASFLLYPALEERDYNARRVAWDEQVDEINAASRARGERLPIAGERRAVEQSKVGQELLEQGTLDQKVDFLVKRAIMTPEEIQDEYAARAETPDFPSQPWYFDSVLAFLLLPMIVAIGASVLIRVVVPRAEAIFLFGDETKRHIRRERRRERVIWGFVVAFMVSVIAGVVTSWMD